MVMEQKETKNTEKSDISSVYEVSFLLFPSISTDEIPARAQSIKDALTSLGGVIIADETPVLIDLAYSMTKIVGVDRHKVTSGYFGWVKFEMNKENISAVKKFFDEHVEV